MRGRDRKTKDCGQHDGRARAHCHSQQEVLGADDLIRNQSSAGERRQQRLREEYRRDRPESVVTVAHVSAVR